MRQGTQASSSNQTTLRVPACRALHQATGYNEGSRAADGFMSSPKNQKKFQVRREESKPAQRGCEKERLDPEAGRPGELRSIRADW
ncbi:hypothetical protein PGT21_013208 [Puccinia graminis f. sp. tritici]|uniref:Uncharacterized protein n=1 Tax=Puccinia graminis f. sp. tritici TaxID=56615 RepID=A0A5B0MB35_PUCGR|nr:hypothetical protein PGT21_013208 [Puccinia graminis f. sp. tritici]